MTATETLTAAADYIGVPEVAKVLGIHPHTVRSLIKSGRLPALRTGQRFRVRRSDIDALACA